MFSTVSRGFVQAHCEMQPSDSGAPRLFDCAVMSRDQEAGGTGLDLAGATPLSSMCGSECFRLITESNNAAEVKELRDGGRKTRPPVLLLFFWLD